jgi:hypothetical protein
MSARRKVNHGAMVNILTKFNRVINTRLYALCYDKLTVELIPVHAREA